MPDDDVETSMLQNATADGAFDSRSSSGGWRSAAFIIGVEIAERFAYYGIGANLISYLTGHLGQSTAAAAANVNAWSGTAMLLPLLGSVVADSFLGRYRTIVMASLLYILGIGLLTVSAVLTSLICISDSSCSPPAFQVTLFFFSLYLVAVAQGGYRPCTQAFGADQFDGQDPVESKAKSSFFNWWNFAISAGALVTTFVVSYVQDNLGWALGFGILCVAMVMALIVFLLGTSTYRYVASQNDRGQAVPSRAFFRRQRSEQSKFLGEALTAPNELKEEAKSVVRLIPIWCSCLMFGTVIAQSSTFFTKQGATMDRTIVSGFQIPAASLQCFTNVATITFILIYDRAFVPIAQAFTGKPSGITTLQRIGIGISVSVFTMVTAALVEMKRLKTPEQHEHFDRPSETVPMSVWWLAPQYLLIGIADVFTMVGMQEFFYDQVPTELRSIGLALFLSVLGVGSFLSSFLVSVIGKVSGRDGRDGWFSTDLNTAHLDYFYWLLAGFSSMGFSVYLYFAKSYTYS